MELQTLIKHARIKNIIVKLKNQPHGEIQIIKPCGKATTVQFQPKHLSLAIGRAIELIEAI